MAIETRGHHIKLFAVALADLFALTALSAFATFLALTALFAL